jgi:hypothetical protein
MLLTTIFDAEHSLLSTGTDQLYLNGMAIIKGMRRMLMHPPEIQFHNVAATVMNYMNMTVNPGKVTKRWWSSIASTATACSQSRACPFHKAGEDLVW